MMISQAGLNLIEQSEGFESRVYDDNGKPAIGFGHDLLPGESFPDGVTQAQAQQMIVQDLELVQHILSLLVPANCTQGQWDALCDFGYNLGVGALRTMLGHGWDQVPVQILLWDHVNGVVSLGLSERRNRELTLFLQP
jgi:lysozyme